ncbi:MAG: rhamnan synthesis F family protein [Candidatus Binataceae bacterium]
MTNELDNSFRSITPAERERELSRLKVRIAQLEQALEDAKTELARSETAHDAEIREIETALTSSARDNSELKKQLAESRAHLGKLERQMTSSRWLTRALIRKVRELPGDVLRRREASRAKARRLQERRGELLRLRVFDAKWYASEYPTAAAKGDPVLHFITRGRAEGHSPNPAFDERLYRDANPNLAPFLKYGFFSSGSDHFLKQGMAEIVSGYPWRRFPFRAGGRLFDFDEAAYLAGNSDVRELVQNGTCDSGLQHFLLSGFAEIKSGARKAYSDSRLVCIREVLDCNGAGRRARHACIFAHYDRQNVVDDCVVEYLKAILALDAEITFVSACDDRAQLNKIAGIASRIIIKNDAGRDFGSWYAALKAAGTAYFDKFEYLLFANDSVYCPIMPLDKMFNVMRDRQLNMWGITESIQLGQYHLQSYFLAFDRAARARVVERFLPLYEGRPYLTKFGQIIEYELGLTKLALDERLRVGAYCSNAEIENAVESDPKLRAWRKLVRKGFQEINPSHHLWNLLITRFDCPTLKADLLRDNPYNAAGVPDWPRIVADRGIGAESIRRHLERTSSSMLYARPAPTAAGDRSAGPNR